MMLADAVEASGHEIFGNKRTALLKSKMCIHHEATT
jgi:hypothetical protein